MILIRPMSTQELPQVTEETATYKNQTIIVDANFVRWVAKNKSISAEEAFYNLKDMDNKSVHVIHTAYREGNNYPFAINKKSKRNFMYCID